MTRSDDLMAGVARRLRAMASRPVYRFKRTSRAAAARHVERSTHLLGFSEPEIQTVESFAGTRLPETYRTFLAFMGRSCGDLFCGSDLPRPNDFPAHLLKAQGLLLEEQSGLSLPPRSVVILIHQGYSFAFLEAAPVTDCPVLRYVEGDASFDEAAASFQALLEMELTALERAHERSLASGGYFLTVYPDGSGRQEHPSRNSGVRPLDFEDDFLD